MIKQVQIEKKQIAAKQWKKLKDFQGKYEVHPTLGIRNTKTQKVLKGRHWLGYPKVTLMLDGKKKEVKVHRIVAQHFVKNLNPQKFTIVNHKSGNRNDFRASNLEWMTQSDNMIDRWKRAKTGWSQKYEREY